MCGNALELPFDAGRVGQISRARTVSAARALMTELSLALMLLFAPSAPARPMGCSIHASRESSVATLLAQVNVTYAVALKAAQIGFPAAKLANGALEIEAGCLVYAFELRTIDPPGEIWIDAGNGKILPYHAGGNRNEENEPGARKAPKGKPAVTSDTR
jgi:hypothetical protein